MNPGVDSPRVKSTAAPAALRGLKYGLVFTLVWLLLTGGAMDSWVIGVVMVPLASWCAVSLFPVKWTESDSSTQPVNQGLSLVALLRFIPFFIAESLKGGWQSALIAISPKRDNEAGFIRYVTALPAGRPRLFFVNTVSLLPGTVSVAWEDDAITIHLLDVDLDHYRELQICENRIAALFGLCLLDSGTREKGTEA